MFHRRESECLLVDDYHFHYYPISANSKAERMKWPLESAHWLILLMIDPSSQECFCCISEKEIFFLAL